MTVEQATSADTALVAPAARRGEGRLLGPIAVGLALLSAFATFIVLADFTPILPTHNVVVTLLLVNAGTVLLLLGVIVREVWQIVQARRTGRAAARLHVRIVGLFSIIAAAPAILVAIVASVTLDRGLDRLFSTRTRAAIENSLIVAEAYLRDHAQIVRSDIIVMATDIARSKPIFEPDHAKLQQYLTFQASVRGLAAAIVLDKDLNVIARADLKINQTFAMPPRDALPRIGETEPQLVLLPDTNYVAAVVKLHNFDDYYLYLTRLLDPSVVPQLQATRESVTEYAAIEARRYGVQIAFALMYTVIALTVLLSAVWVGLDFANRLVAPIRRLIGAANVVSTGNLHVRVPVHQSEGDLAQLGETFNRMTQELRSQRDDIMRARDLIDSRRRFTEAVLGRRQRGRDRRRRRRLREHPQSFGGEADRPHRRRGARPAADGSVPGTRRFHGGGAIERAHAGSGHDHPQWPRAQSVGPHHQRAIQRIRSRLCGDARRHHRIGRRPAHLRLGGHRAPHRA